MTKYDKFISLLTQEKFIDMMCLNCAGCPAYPCKGDEEGMPIDGIECEEELRKWCEQPA